MSSGFECQQANNKIALYPSLLFSMETQVLESLTTIYQLQRKSTLTLTAKVVERDGPTVRCRVISEENTRDAPANCVMTSNSLARILELYPSTGLRSNSVIYLEL